MIKHKEGNDRFLSITKSVIPCKSCIEERTNRTTKVTYFTESISRKIHRSANTTPDSNQKAKRPKCAVLPSGIVSQQSG